MVMARNEQEIKQRLNMIIEERERCIDKHKWKEAIILQRQIGELEWVLNL